VFKSDLVDSKERQDRILIASIAGVASRHARTRRLSGPARAAAVAELAELAAGRSDLLARHAGMTVGMIREGDIDEDQHLLAAQLCIEAGADTSTNSAADRCGPPPRCRNCRHVRLDYKDSHTIAEWERFLALARHAGAQDDAQVGIAADPRYGDDALDAYVIETEDDPDATETAPETVTVPARLVHDLLYVVRTVAQGDGDARGLVEPAKEVLETSTEYLLRPVLGRDPYQVPRSDDGEQGGHVDRVRVAGQRRVGNLGHALLAHVIDPPFEVGPDRQ